MYQSENIFPQLSVVGFARGFCKGNIVYDFPQREAWLLSVCVSGPTKPRSYGHETLYQQVSWTDNPNSSGTLLTNFVTYFLEPQNSIGGPLYAHSTWKYCSGIFVFASTFMTVSTNTVKPGYWRVCVLIRCSSTPWPPRVKSLSCNRAHKCPGWTKTQIVCILIMFRE